MTDTPERIEAHGTTYIRADKAVKVKPLVWKFGIEGLQANGIADYTYMISDPDSLGKYEVYIRDRVQDQSHFVGYECSEDEAKAKAQAHHDSLVKSLLEVVE